MPTHRRFRTLALTLMAVVAAGSLFLGCARQVSEPEVETPPPPEPAPQEKTLNIPEGGDYPQEFTAKCTRVIDGDTIELENGENVRYIGMDTPEMRPVEAWAKRATEVNRELVEGEIVRLVLDVEERDRYGRLLAYVYVDDTFVNAELVRRGLAQVATYPPNVKHQEHYLKLQREAREEGRGLWSEDAGTAGHADGLVDSEG